MPAERQKKTIKAKAGPYPGRVRPNSYRKTQTVMQNTARVMELQGHEQFGLRDLLKTYSPNEILHRRCDMPIILYRLDDQTQIRRYIPDYWIPKENLIIEIKSVFTFEIAHKMNMAKQLACVKSGFQFEFRLYDKKGNFLKSIK